MISIICVFNNKEILDNYLLKSLKDQTVDYELILIDNTERKFESAAEALNYGGKKANGDYLMFVHQDVALFSEVWLENTQKILNSISNLGIVGVAGKIKEEKFVISNITQGEHHIEVGIPIDTPMNVQTLDECLVIIPKSVFELLKFDENVCDDWHLYAVDYCLSVKSLDFDVYVIPISLYHLSEGHPVSNEYYPTMKKLIDKHNKTNRWICTTIGNWNTSLPFIVQKMLYKIIFYFDK